MIFGKFIFTLSLFYVGASALGAIIIDKEGVAQRPFAYKPIHIEQLTFAYLTMPVESMPLVLLYFDLKQSL